jgi:hypothetical protein
MIENEISHLKHPDDEVQSAAADNRLSGGYFCYYFAVWITPNSIYD